MSIHSQLPSKPAQETPEPEDRGARIAQLERRLLALEQEKAQLCEQLTQLGAADGTVAPTANPPVRDRAMAVSASSPPAAKLALFRTLFRGREDVYARRWENGRTGKSGYVPACRGGWTPRGKAGQAGSGEEPEREYLPLTDQVIRCHLRGEDPADTQRSTGARDFTIGVYPLLPDETCFFLAVDFDGSAWQQDALAYQQTCRSHGVPVALERSRSGNGGHVWVFFAHALPAALARELGSYLLTLTMEQRPEIGLASYDRLFPSQDTMPAGGFGNLIALPLQRRPREQGNSLFVDERFVPYPDQIAFLAAMEPLSREAAQDIVASAQRQGDLIGVRRVALEEDDPEPWTARPSRRRPEPPITGKLPDQVELVLGNQLYVPREPLPPSLLNRLIRLAAFQNPEFHRAQAMRLSTFGKPRIICCAELLSHHLALPRGCIQETFDLLRSLGIRYTVLDERCSGTALPVTFCGTLRSPQEEALEALLPHETGVLAAGTAFGKTVVAARLVAERGVSTLVLVHRRQLMDQWVARLAEFLNIERKEIGQIGGGKHRPTGRLDVAVIQSLCRKGTVSDAVGEYGHLIVDECHHLSAHSFEQVARACKARYVLGLSATTVRKDGHQPIIFMQCGPVRYRVDPRAQALLCPFDHQVLVRPTDWQPAVAMPPDRAGAIQLLYGALVEDEKRNRAIVQDVRDAVAAGRSPVVLSERTRHIELLAEALRPHVQHVLVFRGGMGARQRAGLMEELSAIPEGDTRVLLSTGRYLGEGFDDARLDSLFLAMPISWQGTLTQYAGRLHRLHDHKTEVVIYDYADLQVPMLAKMHQKRLRGYRALGYRISTSTPRGDLTLR